MVYIHQPFPPYPLLGPPGPLCRLQCCGVCSRRGPVHGHGGYNLHLGTGGGVYMSGCGGVGRGTGVGGVVHERDMGGSGGGGAVAPCSLGHFVKLMHREGVKELVGEVDGGTASGYLGDMAMPKHLGERGWEWYTRCSFIYMLVNTITPGERHMISVHWLCKHVSTMRVQYMHAHLCAIEL